MLRTLFLKRFESSAYALRVSLERYRDKIDLFADNLEQGSIASLEDLEEIKKQLEDGLSPKVDNLTSADPSIYNLTALKQDLDRDQAILEVLIKICQLIEQQDGKIETFAKLFNDLVENPPAGRKILVFSYYADTIIYLKKRLARLIKTKDFKDKAGFVSSRSRSDIEKLAIRFSPKSKNGQLFESLELDYLFSTDVLSEGQNLQDCGILINFDLHWNPVRMIQRNGRIDRLGSEHEAVVIYNVHPEAHLETYLRLVQRLEQKIDRIKSTIGTDVPILGEEAKPLEYIDQIESRQQALKMADLYDAEQSEGVYGSMINEEDLFLSEDEYINDLRLFLKEADQPTKQRIERLPLAKWGYMPLRASNLKSPPVISFN